MAKQLLRIDLDTSFHLYGISCHLKDYRFAWTVNKSLGVEFKKTKPYTTVDGLEFSKYEYALTFWPSNVISLTPFLISCSASANIL